MNYRHAFHAGNFADVLKHLVLARILDYLRRKPAPFRVLDTHAGIGWYDLTGAEAERSPEWRDGIARLLQEPLPPDAAALAAPYLDAVRAENHDGELRIYPGSPLIARRFLRPDDRLSLCELHPEDAELLRGAFPRDPQVRISATDGWEALRAQLPFAEKRGLILVDPPFELPDEFSRLVQGLVDGHKRFATGIFALWYPIKDPAAVERFVADLNATGIARILRVELAIRPGSTPPRLHGSGMIVVNPPFTLQGELEILLPPLADRLKQSQRGSWRLEWIRGER